MNTEITESIFLYAPAKGGRRLVLLALAGAATADGVADISVPEIAQRAGLSVRAVQVYLRDFEAEGAIEVYKGKGKVTAKGPQNLYRVRVWDESGRVVSPDGVIPTSPSLLFLDHIPNLSEEIVKYKRDDESGITPERILHILAQERFDVVKSRKAINVLQGLMISYEFGAIVNAIQIAVCNGVRTVAYLAGVLKTNPNPDPTKPLWKVRNERGDYHVRQMFSDFPKAREIELGDLPPAPPVGLFWQPQRGLAVRSLVGAS
jgi:AcrR family transcriptional regulator